MPTCFACRERASITLVERRFTPLCSACLDRVGQPVAIGQRAVCVIGSVVGTVNRFDESTWLRSGLAELASDGGSNDWYPLAELVPTVGAA